MTPSKKKPLHTRLLCAALSISLAALAPAQSVAQVIRTAPVRTGPGVPGIAVVPTVSGTLNVGGPSISLTDPLGASLGGVNTPTPITGTRTRTAIGAAHAGQTLPAAEKARPLAAPQTAVAAGAVQPVVRRSLGTSRTSPALTAPKQAPGAAPTAKKTLETGARQVGESKSASGRFSALGSLFFGSRKTRLSELPAVGLEAQGRSAARSGLSRLGLGELEALASDSSKPLDERKKAVSFVSKQGGAQAKASLERIADSNPEGGAEDYEVHRAALRALAEDFHDVRSLRPISEAHKNAILSKLEKDKPELYLTDYDDTLEEFRAPVSPEIAEGLKAAADAGVETAILTDRQLERRDEKDTSIADSLAPMTLAQKQAVTVISNRGTELSLYGRDGEPVLLRREKIEWSAGEKAAITEVAKILVEKYGQGEFDGKTEFWSGHSYSPLLPAGLPAETVKEAAEFFHAELAKRGIDIPVVGRTAKSEKDPPYLSVSKIDKTIGMAPIMRNQRAFQQVRDALRYGLPARFAAKAFKLLQRFAPRRIPAKKVLAVGDQFFDTRISDTGFAKGAPGGTIISVGGKADPRLDDVVVWPAEGRAASLEIMGAVGKVAPSEMNKKAVAGLFAQRTVSIAAFILTSIAYPFLAVPVVGWTGYGILMSFGPLAAIAAGPFNGLIADHLSARNGMALNTLIRAVSSLALPVLAAFGYLNFTTLLIASFANGWLLSSIMTTENAYIKRLAGAKNVFMISNLAWMNYLAIQVVLGLIVGIGSIVDTWNPMIAFTINAAVNAFIVLPIIWFTMPTLSPQPKTLLKMESRLAKLENKEGAEAEIAELKKSIASREAFLKKDIEANREAAASDREELAKLRAEKPSGIRARLALAAEIRSLEADIALRKRTAAKAEAELAREAVTFRGRLLGIAKFLKSNWFSAGLFLAGVAGYFYLDTTLPLIAALLFWITRTVGFKVLWYGKGSDVSPRESELTDKIAAAKKAGESVDKSWKKELDLWKSRLPKALLLLSVIALMMYPFQYLALPKIAVLLVGQEAKALLMGQLLGALFFGNMISNAGQAKLSDVKLPFIGKVPIHRLIQAAVVGLGMTWVYTGLVPGSILAAAAAGLLIAGAIALTSRLTKKAWVKFVGLGFAAVWIPYLVWGLKLLPFLTPQIAMILAVLGIGMSFGPAYTTLMGYFFGNAAKDKSGAMGGVQSSFFNAAVSGGYGLLALASSMINPAFPALLAVLGALYLVAGMIFWRGASVLPGLPKTLFHPKEKK